MKSFDIIKELKQLLQESGIENAETEAKLILAHILDCSLNAVYMQDISDIQYEKALTVADKRKLHYPLQYILGEAYFMDRRFAINPDVLIPRGDTEPMVEEIIRLCAGEKLLIADICCGSGAIGISLAAALPQAKIICTDISEAALEIAVRNGADLPNIAFLQGDLCEPLQDRGLFDIIVSNPPYVTAAEMRELQTEVQHEPELALYGGDDGLDFYRRLCNDAPSLLKSGGMLVFEIGCEQEADVCSLLRNAGLKIVKCLQDYGHRPRSVFALKE